MHKFLIILIASITISLVSSAQDIILTHNGDEHKVKVVEVNFDNVKYKKFTNLTGPIYTMYKSEIFMIKYEDGDKDVFKDAENANSRSSDNNNWQEDNSNVIRRPYDAKPSSSSEKKMAAYAELGGVLRATSLSVETMFVQSSNFHFGLRYGLGIAYDGYGDFELGTFVHPTFLVGNGSHFYDGGIGLTGIFDNGIFFHTNHGYRFQPEGKNFFIRGNFNLLYNSRWIMFAPGISYGIRF